MKDHGFQMNPHRIRHQASAGFTLVEVMIVVAIIGILAAIAYPAYTSSVIKGKRSEGRTALADLMQQQERYMTQTGCYGVQNGANCAAILPGASGAPFKLYSGNAQTGANYLLGVRACTFTPAPSLRDCAEVYATPQSPQLVDPNANVLWIRSTGEKGCNGGDTSVCWK